MSKITEITLTSVSIPVNNPVSAAGMVFKHRDYLLAEVATDDGLKGIGFSYIGVGGGEAAMIAARDLLASKLIGRNAEQIRDLYDLMYDTTLLQGRAGIVMNGLSAIDIALYDRKSRQADQTLCDYLGGDSTKAINAYASGGYYAPDKTVEDLKAEVQNWVDLGFDAVKIKCGALSLKEEEERVRAVRDIIGPDRILMLDLYNAMPNLATAIRYVAMFERFDPYWIEDPFKPDEINNFIELSKRTKVPLATGEFHYSSYLFKHILESGASQIIQLEAPRIGGITQFLSISGVAESYGAMVNPCWFQHIHNHLVPAIRCGEFVEYFPNEDVLNFGKILAGDEAKMVNGKMYLSAKSGLGFDFDYEKIQQFEHLRAVIS